MAILKQKHCPFCGSDQIDLVLAECFPSGNIDYIPYVMRCAVCLATGPCVFGDPYVFGDRSDIISSWQNRNGTNVPDAVDCPFCGGDELITKLLPTIFLKTHVTCCNNCLAAGPKMTTAIRSMERWCHRELKPLFKCDITYTAKYLAENSWWTEAFDAYIVGGRVGYMIVSNETSGYMVARMKPNGNLTAVRYVPWDTLMVLKPAEQSDYAVFHL